MPQGAVGRARPEESLSLALPYRWDQPLPSDAILGIPFRTPPAPSLGAC